MKKRNIARFACILSIVSLLVALSGCNTKSTKAYTFNVDNGDKIKITLDTTDEYDLSSDLPFTVSRNETTQSQGTFIEADSFQQLKCFNIQGYGRFGVDKNNYVKREMCNVNYK